jgi:hypothetical protein
MNTTTESEVTVGGVYTQCGNDEYVVTGVARHPATLKLVVVYVLRSDALLPFWRSLAEFKEKFTRKKT